MSTVFIALQTNEDTRPIIEAIELDNPHAVVNRQPAMVKIDAPGRLVIRRETIEEQLGRTSTCRS
jgi:phenol hydroxylase P2 protein